jgi:hypothetical protein
MTKPEPGCVNCGHSHTYDGPFRPYKARRTSSHRHTVILV